MVVWKYFNVRVNLHWYLLLYNNWMRYWYRNIFIDFHWNRYKMFDLYWMWNWDLDRYFIWNMHGLVYLVWNIFKHFNFVWTRYWDLVGTVNWYIYRSGNLYRYFTFYSNSVGLWYWNSDFM